jgi:hypothetical protein
MDSPRESVEQHRGVIPRRVRALNAHTREQEQVRAGALERGGPHPRGRLALERGGPHQRERLALERGGPRLRECLALERGGPRPRGCFAVSPWWAAGGHQGCNRVVRVF